LSAELDQWLKNTIPGIVLLGAVGSVLAVVLVRLLFAMRDGFLRAPLRWHQERKLKQASFLGGAAANIEHDKTGRMLTVYLAYHLCRLTLALALFLFSAILAGNVLVFQERVALTVGLFLSVFVAFLALYWVYFEFEYIYRTYLFFWKKWDDRSEERYQQYLLEKKEKGEVVSTDASKS
jgi:hypothetical protein